MITRRNTFFAMAASVFMLVLASSQAMADDAMARFDGTSQGNGVMMVSLTIIGPGGSRIRLAVPNEKMTKGATGTPQPKKDLAAVIKKLNPGDVVKISAEKGELGPTLISIDPYDAKPGEDTPNGYVFSKTFDNPGKNPTLTVVLTKFGVEFKFFVATKKDEKGVPVQDPDVLAAIDKLQSGNSVWIQYIQQSGKLILQSIEPYVDPKLGKLGKQADTEVDGHRVPSAEVETDGGKIVTLYVPVKEVGKAFLPDKTVLAQLKKLKMGTQVAYRVHEEGDKLWLREILPAPASAAAKTPMAETPKKR